MDKLITHGELKSPGYQLVPLNEYLGMDDKSETGVWLDSHEEIEEIAGFVSELPVVALNFPVFTDGRAYSSASILRRRYGYEGELRAIGDVRIDQLEQMRRCGFDSYDLNDDQDAEKAMGVLLNGYSHSYQATAGQPALFEVR